MIDKQRIKLHTAAQLLVRGFDQEIVMGDFTDEEKAQTRATADELRQVNGNGRPAAAELDTTGWLKRRIMLRITGIPSTQLARHMHKKVGLWR